MKSHGETRAGSSPAGVEIFFILIYYIFYNFFNKNWIKEINLENFYKILIVLSTIKAAINNKEYNLWLLLNKAFYIPIIFLNVIFIQRPVVFFS